MNNQDPKKKLQQTETLEIALHLLHGAKKNLRMTKKDVAILNLSKNTKKNSAFKKLKSLTELDENGKYSPNYVLKIIRKYRLELSDAAQGTETVISKNHSTRSDSKKEHAKKLLKDLKIPQDTFRGALNCLHFHSKQIMMNKKQKNIIIAARKGNRNVKGRNRTFVKLKNLTKINKFGSCSPYNIMEVIQKNQLELIKFIDGKTGSEDNQMEKSLALDTNYKYPTKTSNSIWTVKNK